MYLHNFRNVRSLLIKKMRNLAVFDFDHTILEDNSDTAIFSLSKDKDIPQDIKRIHYTDGWTAFMQAVFHHLYDQGVTTESINSLIKKLPAVQGMVHLIKTLHNRSDYDLIIISDSNAIFIDTWLINTGIDKCFLKIFTNPAEVDNGMLKITPYHFQTGCKLSTSNLCKGQILDEFIEFQKQNQVLYSRVVYVGDGVNDFCPVLRLGETDLACVRQGYKLSDLIEKAKIGIFPENAGQNRVLKAEVLVWANGNDILKKLDI